MAATTEHVSPEQFQFQAEVNQVLGLVINSLYSNKEIFLRELISNASDAIDKLKYRALTQHDLVTEGAPLEIRILPDAEAGTLTLEDFGVGMTRDELIENLGTIAHSGTRRFLEAAREQAGAGAGEGGDALGLIGQFGVGFYSAYLVADRVEVVSRAAGAEGGQAYRWSSDAKGGFTVTPAEREHQGTSIVLHLKDDAKDFLDAWKLKDLVRRYSDYVSHPIKLQEERWERPEGAAEDAEAEKQLVLEQANRGKALWQRPKGELKDEDYQEFYKHLGHDWEAPLAWTHFKVEGVQLFTGVLFLPRKAPFDLYDPNKRRGVRLYVKRVFIMDDCEELVPQWLRFLRGLIDSDDLPLNVSRELLQDSTVLRSIRKQIVKKALDLLDELAKDRPDDYRLFWEQFGPVLKEGLHFAPESRDRLAKLVRFRSSKVDGLTSLAEYVERMPEGQDAIYYIVGGSEKAVAASPHLEALRSKGYEVLYMTDPIDEWAVEGLSTFDDKRLVSALKADLPLEGQDEAKDEGEDQRKDELAGLLAKFEQVLGEQVAKVQLSKRLTSSPTCLVVPEGGLPAHLERMLRMNQQDVPATKRILELNPKHPLVESLRKLHADDADAPQLTEWIEVLYDQSLLAEGSPIDDPARFAQRVTKLLEEAAALAVPKAEA